MSGVEFFLYALLIIGGFFLFMFVLSRVLTPEQIQESLHGKLNPQLFCPHCQVTGKVRTKKEKTSKGIHGGKATGAVLTGGVSLLATGLSRKEDVTKCHCENCKSEWVF
jgi:hypothetical protein